MNKIIETENISSPIFRYNKYDNILEGETFVTDHIFALLISGNQDVWIGDKKWSFKAGDFRFFRRNQLTKYMKSSSSEGFKSIMIQIDQRTLKNMSSEYRLIADGPYLGGEAQLLMQSSYLTSYFDSLLPYLDSQEAYDSYILSLKARELLFLVLKTNPKLKNVLFDFSEPGKIDIEAFMNSHYRYNIGLDRFAFMTGRSLSGFKRDFGKCFGTSPGKWLLKKRLTEANYLLQNQHVRPSDIYLDLGFQDLSHFSKSYKNEFGISPTSAT